MESFPQKAHIAKSNKPCNVVRVTTILKVFLRCEQVKRKRHVFSFSLSLFIRFDLPQSGLHLCYSYAIYRIKYSSLTFTIRFKACYFYVFTFVVAVKLCTKKGLLHTQINAQSEKDRDSVCAKQIETTMLKGKKWYQLGLMRWNWYEKQLRICFFRHVHAEYLPVSCKQHTNWKIFIINDSKWM